MIMILQVNGINLTIMFHQEVVKTLQEVGVSVILVCSRRICGPSPLHGTIVNNVETDCSKQAFNTRVRNNKGMGTDFLLWKNYTPIFLYWCFLLDFRWSLTLFRKYYAAVSSLCWTSLTRCLILLWWRPRASSPWSCHQFPITITCHPAQCKSWRCDISQV